MQIDEPSRNQGMIIIKQVKGIVVVTMDKPKYKEIFFAILNGDQFWKLNNGLTKKIEGKIQRIVRKVKLNLKSQEYFCSYPTGSSPGKFYGTAKLQWSIFSNINKRNCDLSKYLAKTLLPLSISKTLSITQKIL